MARAFSSRFRTRSCATRSTSCRRQEECGRYGVICPKMIERDMAMISIEKIALEERLKVHGCGVRCRCAPKHSARSRWA